jgi:TatD DNase family protein
MSRPANQSHRFYDAHNHLQDDRLAPALGGILKELPETGLAACIVNGTCENDWPAVQRLAREHDWIIPAFGLHPWYANERSAGWFDRLQRLLDETPRATIGEIGLDRWMRDPDLNDQGKVFVAQLQLAAERNIAASIHCLKAWGHLEEALKNHERPARGFLLHSYGGSAEMAAILAKLGAYFSISGYFAHERKAAQREVFRSIPLDRLLVETDAPDMLPPKELVAHDLGENNDPRNLPRIYEFAAGLYRMPLAEFTGRIAANFTSLFS